MTFDTKIAIVVRDDLAVWQKLNVTAFLTSGIVGASGAHASLTPERIPRPGLCRQASPRGQSDSCHR
jgi:hypothetical protein